MLSQELPTESGTHIENGKKNGDILARARARARTLGLAIWRPSLPDLPQIPWLLDTRIDITTFSLPSIAASQARRSSSSSALDIAISASDAAASALKLWMDPALSSGGGDKARREDRDWSTPFPLVFLTLRLLLFFLLQPVRTRLKETGKPLYVTAGRLRGDGGPCNGPIRPSFHN